MSRPAPFGKVDFESNSERTRRKCCHVIAFGVFQRPSAVSNSNLLLLQFVTCTSKAEIDNYSHVAYARLSMLSIRLSVNVCMG